MSKGMLKGDLSTTTLPQILSDLAGGVASGCLHVDDGVEESKVYLRGGRVYAVAVPGRRPQLGARLVSSGALGPEALAEALEAQRTELQGWRLGELLVHLGYVDQPVVEAFINEQVRESMSDLLRWGSATWRFRVNERTREDVAPPVEVADLLAEVDRRRLAWQSIQEVIHGPEAVPLLASAGSTSSEMEIDADAWSLLCKVDGTRSIGELARDCGFTLFEAGQVVFSLVQAGLVEVEEVVNGSEPMQPEALVDLAHDAHVETFEDFTAALSEADEVQDTVAVASRLAAALSEGSHAEAGAEVPSQGGAPTVEHSEDSPAESVPESVEESPEKSAASSVADLISSALSAPRKTKARTLADLEPAELEAVDGSISRVSEALSALMGPSATGDAAFASPPKRAPRPTKTDPEAERKAAEKAKRDAKRRERDAAELAAAQAELEMGRLDDQARYADLEAAGNEAVVVDLGEVRRENAERDADKEAARLAAEEAEAARVADAAVEAALDAAVEADRVAAAQAEAERIAAEQAEAERVAAEHAAAAAAAAQAEAERIAAEQAEADRLAAEHAEADRLAAEHASAEAAAAQAEADRIAAEQAEVERLAAEHASAEAAADAERLAAEQAEAERLAAEHTAAEQAAAHAEAERVAAEQAEAERVAAEHAAAEQAAAHAEAERVAAEQAAQVAEELRREQDAAQAADDAAQLAAAAAARDLREAEELAASREAADVESRAVDPAEQAAAFAELAATADSAVETAAPIEELADEPADDGYDDAPLPTYDDRDTDTASLMRELSSLGFDDDPPPAAPARPAPSAPRPASGAAQATKKRKGLFGR